MRLIKTTVSNAITNIVRNKLVNFLCFGIIAFTLLIFGIFNYITHSLEAFSEGFAKNIKAIFYFHENVQQEEVDLLINKLKQSILVQDVAYTSRNQAEIGFARQFPELQYILSEFKESPFPASIEVEFKSQYQLGTKIISFIEDIEKLSVIESKQINIDWAKKIIAFKRFISVVGLFLSLILIFVSAFIIFNVIKISIFYRKDEINVLKLVGATDWYIKFPFVIEGGLLGFFGSLLAGGLLFITIKLFPIYASFVFDMVKGMIDFRTIPSGIFIRLIVLGTVIGLFSSYISAKQFLKS
ncbi:MAG: FtsX-like permease family protein [Candidatus Aminicenantes bacterium]|nr:FtsX-like permease family protein [Candidatus Aminicenantes bacterium]NIM81120.1 FtsX-like permease family protein [Candidatus Aminicenantes bacterium]NIN20494.1 FtsX-like permease family protein [Candidatus Aminicenantes bacterium]NIN44267.1 FtsX-like permease family protein [Candidatus Aminicenantes bacterium]NIN87086.1 FtsX-like permease family protein [Candidatus Aminicenantes bacterium]